VKLQSAGVFLIPILIGSISEILINDMTLMANGKSTTA